jgi:hypothetical protein
MSSLTLPPNLTGIIGLATNKPLSDPSLPSSPVSFSLPEQNYSVGLPGNAGRFTISADETASLTIVNSASDANVAGYFDLDRSTAPAAADPSKAPALEAPVVFDPAKAYVVLTALSPTGKVSGKLTVGSDGALGLDGNQTLDVSACTAFARTTLVWDALKQAASNFKTIFPSSELLALTPTEALSYGIQGGLSLSLKFTFTSLAGALADSVLAVLNQAGPFSFEEGNGLRFGPNWACGPKHRKLT